MVRPNLIEPFSTARPNPTFLVVFTIVQLGIHDDG